MTELINSDGLGCRTAPEKISGYYVPSCPVRIVRFGLSQTLSWHLTNFGRHRNLQELINQFRGNYPQQRSWPTCHDHTLSFLGMLASYAKYVTVLHLQLTWGLFLVPRFHLDVFEGRTIGRNHLVPDTKIPGAL